MAVKPANNSGYHTALLLLPPFRQVEHVGNRNKAGENAVIGLTSNPKDGGVIVGVPIGILDDCLGLANASQAIQSTRLTEDSIVLVMKNNVQLAQYIVSTCEE